MKIQKHYEISDCIKVNDTILFVLKNGNIAAEDPDNILIYLKETDKINILNLTVGETSTAFFVINDTRINALFAESFVTLPKDSEFVDIYTTEKHDGVFCKYKNAQNEGIIYVSQTEISLVISHKEGYEDIWFENETFFTKKQNEERYFAINQAGQVIMEKCFKFKKVKNFELFYSTNNFFTESAEGEVPEEIESIEVLDTEYYKKECINFHEKSSDSLKNIENINFEELLPAKVKICTSKGIYFYNKYFECLVGPLNNPEILTIYHTSGLPYINRGTKENPIIKNEYYIFDNSYKNGHPIKTVYYIVDDSVVDKISSSKGFLTYLYYLDFNNINKLIAYFEDDASKNVYNPHLKLIANIGEDGYTSTNCNAKEYGEPYNECTIKLYNNNHDELISCICSNDDITTV